ncbi:unnamed protein product [Meganyctiphanes norvegica]|uniref:Uncharacterized protein n=1 Tax=Meganyctiphanes norvegica TaxID=48144 RepID=A0AAV2PLT0_MEGNR
METNVSNAAWQTPASLLKLAARTAAEALIHSTVPSNIFSDTWYQNVDDEYDKDRFDETYRCLTVALTHPDDKQYAKEKEHLICTLSELRHWWDGQDGLALLPAKLQKEVHYYIIDCLESECFVCIEHEDILDCECFNCLSRIGISGISCLFRWLRMLLFSGQTKGKLLPMIKLDSVGCAAFACLLDSLAPFPRIQWLDFEPCSFMEPVLIKTILKNSPNIRSLRIGEKSIKFLNYVEMFCPNLELLYMHDPGYSDNLYELFFSGISKETVRKIVSDNCFTFVKHTFKFEKNILNAY